MEITPKKTNLPAVKSSYDVLANVPAEEVWLANFTSDNTRVAYRRALREFIVALGLRNAEELYGVQKVHVIAWRDHMKKTGCSKGTIATRLAALSSLYKVLADKNLCSINPVSGVKRPKTGTAGMGSGKTPALTPAQVRTMLDAPSPTTVQGVRDRALLHVYFYTGCRLSEPGSLRVSDLRKDRDYWVLEMTTKGDQTNTIAIHTECQVAVQKYLDVSGHGDDRNGLLFRHVKNPRDKKPISRTQFYRLFEKYARIAALPTGVTPHSARATFITQAYEAGWQGEDIQRTVNHASITTTEGYNHTVKRHRKSASFAMNY